MRRALAQASVALLAAALFGCGPDEPATELGQLREAVADTEWASMVATEESIRAIEPNLRRLARSLMNLELPDASARLLFDPSIRVSDLSGAPGPWTGIGHGPVEGAQLETTQTEKNVPRGELALWRPLLDGLDYVEHARFAVERARLGADGNALELVLRFSGAARSPEGEAIGIRARVGASMRRTEDSDPSVATSWRIDRFETREMELLRAPRSLFAEVLDLALPEPEARREARRSRHAEIALDALLDPDAPRPHAWLSGPSQDRHPAVSTTDIDGDGWDDLYVMPRFGPNLLLVNQRDGTFAERTEAYGLALVDHSAVALFADFDNDGDADAFVGRSLAPSVYLENVDGRFEERSDTLLDGDALPMLVTSAATADVDGDGLLDLYLSTYAYHMLGQERRLRGKAEAERAPLAGFLSPEASLRMAARARRKDAHPILSVVGPPNVLLLGRGDGRFERVDFDHPLSSFRHTYQATFSDYDGDGDSDLYLANDYAPNQLLRNEGGLRFTDVTAPTGTADVGFGMGASFGDYDEDGRPDLYVSNMYSTAGRRITDFFGDLDTRFAKAARGNTLFRNVGDHFEAVSGTEAGSAQVERAGWSWAGQLADLDNDGRLDVYALSGYYTAPPEIASDVDI